MRVQALLLVLILAATPVQAQNQSPEISDIRMLVGATAATATAASSADIAGNHQEFIFWEVDVEEKDFGDEVLLVEMFIYTPNGVLVVRPTKVATTGAVETWRGSFPVDDVRLTVGSYPVSMEVYDRNGGRTSCPVQNEHGKCPGNLAVPDTTITWNTIGQSKLELEPRNVEMIGSGYPEQRLGLGDHVPFNVTLADSGSSMMYAMQKVVFVNSYNGSVTDPIKLQAPFTVGNSFLVEGKQDLTVTATDRGGRVAAVSLPIFVDRSAPDVTVTIPALTFHNVTFDIAVKVVDQSIYTATVTFEDETITRSGSTRSPLAPFSFTPDGTGLNNIVVRVIDDVGNQFLRQYNVTTMAATTDSTISVDVSPEFPLPEDDVTVEFTAKQKSGVADLPFVISLEVSSLGTVFSDEVNVPLGGTYKFTFGRTYLPGQYDFNGTIFPLAGINETNVNDQIDVGSFEVFIGKVVRGDNKWYIRVDETGQPSHAVTTGGNTYDLELVEIGNRAVYQFEVGKQTNYWDPLQRITDMDEELKQDGEDSPGVSMILAALVLVGAALLARRRM